MPDQVTIKQRNLLAWKPVKFGRQFSLELVLRDDYKDAGKDLFGRELWIPASEHERRFVVANQEGLTATFLPINPTPPRRQAVLHGPKGKSKLSQK